MSLVAEFLSAATLSRPQDSGLLNPEGYLTAFSVEDSFLLESKDSAAFEEIIRNWLTTWSTDQ